MLLFLYFSFTFPALSVSKTVVAESDLKIAKCAKLMNPSSQRLIDFINAIKEKREDVMEVLTAMDNAGKAQPPKTWVGNFVSWERLQYLSWQQFCDLHTIDGDRFKKLLEPLMDIQTCVVQDSGGLLPLRDFLRLTVTTPIPRRLICSWEEMK